MFIFACCNKKPWWNLEENVAKMSKKSCKLNRNKSC